MTLENSRRLVEHFLKVGNNEAANALIKKHPELAHKEKEDKPKKEEKKEKE